jgi:hypothetical protein
MTKYLPNIQLSEQQNRCQWDATGAIRLKLNER